MSFGLPEKEMGIRTEVQMPVPGQEDCSDGVRDVHRLVVECPFDLLGLSNVPHGFFVRISDLGNPHVPGGNGHRGGEDG